MNAIRKKCLVQAVACLMVPVMPAFSAIYDFKSVEHSALGDPAFSFTLDNTTGVSAGGVISFSGVTIFKDGAESVGHTVTFVSPSEIASSFFFLIDTDIPKPKAFFTGTSSPVQFNVGKFAIADGFTDGEGALTISQPSAVPEADTGLLTILGIGVLFMRAFVRRRIVTVVGLTGSGS